MVKQLMATYDGHNLVLEKPLGLPRNTKVKLSLEIPSGGTFQFILSNAQKTGIADWAKNHNHYLYGVAKNDE